MKDKIKTQEKTLEDFRDMIQNEDLKYTMSNLVLDEESVDDDKEINNALRDDPWMKNSSMNKLSDVAEFYCGIKMEKQLRDHFATTDVNEIRDLFQELMTYCADDVLATYHVLHKVYPMFRKVVPHPVSFAALKHINSSFLPTSTDWEDYIHRCEDMYQASRVEVEEKIHSICEETVQLKENADDAQPPWADNPWLSQLDWTIKPVKMTKAGEPYKNQKLPGYPEWYKKLIVKNQLTLTVKSRCSPLLLNILWEKKPIFWTDYRGWCFIVNNDEVEKFKEMKYIHIDPKELLEIEKGSESSFAKKPRRKKSASKEKQNDDAAEVEHDSKGKKRKKTKSSSASKKDEKELQYADSIPVDSEPEFAESDPVVRTNLVNLLDNKKTLFKIPHENGADARVTSLITKPFLRYYEEGILSSSHQLAKDAFEMNVRNSYWVSSRERIMNQFVVYESNLQKQESGIKTKKTRSVLEKKSKEKEGTTTKELGFIIPQIIPMGTITRRAVEKTWLTASNAKKTRLGSELKSLVQAPPGYCFVGADVDSEELWIASLVGDSVFRLHGGTALGWMTLEGTKNAGTDLHSKTAKILGISRNEAKVFNYGRIYGAGVKFATSLLKKFNPTITDEKATEVAKTLYAETKGKTGVVKFNDGNDERLKMWYGGSESAVFNRLESIAEQDNPKTPVLGAGITAALKRTNLNSNSFLPSRINWAIQSSGVDYLHLLLVSMEHLCKLYCVDARLAITVHDEVRYMTKVEDKYKCAMLLQIANLWTRAMFSFQLGIENIPQSCAFFSCVDIDFVLRKEVDFDCITPSNPHPIPHGESIDIYELLKKEGIQEMLETLEDNLQLNKQFEVGSRVYRPVEELDKRMDMSTKLHWLQLQICKTETEFKKKKKSLFNSLDHLQLEKFGKHLANEDKKTDEVACDGLFDPTSSSSELLNAGVVLEELSEKEKEKEKKKPKRKGRKKKNAATLPGAADAADNTPVAHYLNVLGTNAVEATSKKVQSDKNIKPRLETAAAPPPPVEERMPEHKLMINSMMHHLTENELVEIQNS
ncbi:hypothetical protein PMKS-003246 [Pichia membranifaciens]|uniref:DNA polymerase gamma n=1 Tax=Pichia membranifaciens TaxID=4926 RepID=A0A1Q2YJM5_9ASCO|nr:hypothetical protein PMKS-003246 [Pichia membranifaciens]